MMGGQIDGGSAVVFSDASANPNQTVGGWAVYRGGEQVEIGTAHHHSIHLLEAVAIDMTLDQEGAVIVRTDSLTTCKALETSTTGKADRL